MKVYIWTLSFFLFFISCKQNPNYLQRIEGKQIPVNNEIFADSIIKLTVAPYKKQLESEMNQILAYAPTDFYKSRDKAESNIGNFMADLCYKRGNVVFNEKTKNNIDFVLLNFGGIRAGITQGNVTTRNAYEVMPFENSMVVVEMNFEKIQKLINYLAKSRSAHPISKQLQLIFKDDAVVNAKLNGKELDSNRTYYVLTSDYLQHGGDRMNFFKKPISLVNLNYKIRTAILDELEEIDTLKAKEDGRIIRN